MRLSRRKLIALLALAAVLVMLWLERHDIARGSSESFFWVGVGAVALVLIALEFAGVGVNRDVK